MIDIQQIFVKKNRGAFKGIQNNFSAMVDILFDTKCTF